VGCLTRAPPTGACQPGQVSRLSFPALSKGQHEAAIREVRDRGDLAPLARPAPRPGGLTGGRPSEDRSVAPDLPPDGVADAAGASARRAGTCRRRTRRLPGPRQLQPAPASRTSISGARARACSRSTCTGPVCRPTAGRGGGRATRSGAGSSRARGVSRGRGGRRKRGPRRDRRCGVSRPLLRDNGKDIADRRDAPDTPGGFLPRPPPPRSCPPPRPLLNYLSLSVLA
jgi:hypothetical protein